MFPGLSSGNSCKNTAGPYEESPRKRDRHDGTDRRAQNVFSADSVSTVLSHIKASSQVLWMLLMNRAGKRQARTS